MIKNLTKDIVISKNVRFCNSILSKAIGLMFSRKSGKSLIFPFKKERIIPLHMLFVFYPIDVLFLNKNKKIVEMKENFRPFAFYTPKCKASYIIEMPQGSIRRFNLEINDKLGLRPF
ncbi:DUF192 domain-containing protein [Candidatus Woesearchaeota archaeon]|nr:DUF192 domain-containing protein [Candidatus Woesearchaeota archaeon]